ncbi:hypothetical protein [Georgenia yuyongxinii]|uniref:Uncharacterized protein n=1 Tax=Georgenia yuyongxinii TaxID=2589797 RepID=A0A552WUQ3_9MICO|nr:hypothetical protein [Georgenia yuyongxinii]TRW46425.1 hypothetical protein FJ693_05725 [Georgenia yuyongxinii]
MNTDLGPDGSKSADEPNRAPVDINWPASEQNVTTPDQTLLPGEDAPLPMRYGGEPLKPEEVLGVARRMAKVARVQGRKLTHLDVPEELPSPDAPLVPAAYRLPPRTLMFARAKSEMEGVTLTSIITTALNAYISASPGSAVQYKPPKV